MRLHPRQFVRFIDGRLASPTTIASLPAELGVKMGCSSINIQITRDRARKIMTEHRLRYEHFSLIQRAVDHGWCVRFKDNQLEFCYDDDEVFGGSFVLVLKSTKWGTECWVVTFFRARPFYIRSKLRRATRTGTVIRYHEGAAELMG
jgi:hypothetical protein